MRSMRLGKCSDALQGYISSRCAAHFQLNKLMSAPGWRADMLVHKVQRHVERAATVVL